MKVRRSAAAVGVKRATNSAEAIHACEEFIHRYSLGNDAIPLLQASVPGEDYCATFLFNHGELATTMTYHNIRTYPVQSGTGVLRETVSEPAMEQTGAALLASLKWHGVAEIDFRWDGQSPTPQLIEVNPRFWGGLTQSVASGWDYPWLLYRLALDGKVPPIVPGDPTIKTETPVVSLLATLTEIIQDDRQMASMRESFEQMRTEFGNGQRMQGGEGFRRPARARRRRERPRRARPQALPRPWPHRLRHLGLARPAAGAGAALPAGRLPQARQSLNGAAGLVIRQ